MFLDACKRSVVGVDMFVLGRASFDVTGSVNCRSLTSNFSHEELMRKVGSE